MAKLVVLNRVSIDGYFATNNEQTGGMDWFVQDPAVDAASHELVKADTLVIGEITYKLFEASWVPFLNNPDAPAEMKAVAEELTNMRKVVFSENITESDWANTEFHDGNMAEVVKQLKDEDKGDIMIMGSGTVVQQLANEGLIDEYVLIVSPVIAGEGKLLFKDVKQTSLKLLSSQSFDSGNVILHYAVAK